MSLSNELTSGSFTFATAVVFVILAIISPFAFSAVTFITLLPKSTFWNVYPVDVASSVAYTFPSRAYTYCAIACVVFTFKFVTSIDVKFTIAE